MLLFPQREGDDNLVVAFSLWENLFTQLAQLYVQ